MLRTIVSLTILLMVSISGWSEPGNWGEPQTPLAAGVTVPVGETEGDEGDS